MYIVLHHHSPSQPEACLLHSIFTERVKRGRSMAKHATNCQEDRYTIILLLSPRMLAGWVFHPESLCPVTLIIYHVIYFQFVMLIIIGNVCFVWNTFSSSSLVSNCYKPDKLVWG